MADPKLQSKINEWLNWDKVNFKIKIKKKQEINLTFYRIPKLSRK